MALFTKRNFFLFLLSLVVVATTLPAHGASTATWDSDYFDEDNLVENTDDDDDGDWELLAETQSNFGVVPDVDTYCLGVFRFLTTPYDDPTTEDWAYGYYAVKQPVDEVTQEPANCFSLREWVDDHSFTERPAVLFLHGNRGTGSFFWAKWMAYNFMGSSDEYQPIVFAISAPGQGFECSSPFLSPPECAAWHNDQVSVGQGMGTPASWVAGFDGYSDDDDDDAPDEPDQQILWGYTNSAMRAVNVIKKVFGEEPENGGLGFVNDKLVVGGFSAGGITSLLLNTHDSRPDGVFALSASGGWDYSLAQQGSTLAYLLTAADYSDPFDPTYSIDCGAVRLNPGSFPVAEQKACQVVDYFDPINFTGLNVQPKNPTLLLTGAQDEVFPIPAFQATFAFLNQFNEPVFRHLAADFDHAYYWWVNKASTSYEAYGSFDPTYSTQEYYPFNGVLTNIRSYVQRVARGLTPLVPSPPAATSMGSWVVGAKKTYRVVSCWPTSQSWAPEEMRFNISVDKGYHVLPACNNGSFEPNAGQYTLSNTAYNYNSDCTYSTDDDDDDNWEYNEKCNSAQTTVNTSDVFTGVSYTAGIPPSYTCKRFDVIFDGVAFPQHFMYWTELRYNSATTGDAIASGPVQESGTAQSLCLRPRTVDEQGMIDDMFAAAGFCDDDDDDDKVVGGKEEPVCTDLLIDYELAFEDGDVLNHLDKNLVISAGGSLAGKGSVQINSHCDIVIERGGRISTEDGAVGIIARNVLVEGLVEANGANYAGGVSIVATESIGISGEITAESFGLNVAAGQVHFSAAGDVVLTGSVSATGLGSGGAASIFAGRDVTIKGSLFAASLADRAYGGRIEIHSTMIVALDESAQVSTLGDLDDGQIVIFFGLDLLIDSDALIETGDIQSIDTGTMEARQEDVTTVLEDIPSVPKEATQR